MPAKTITIIARTTAPGAVSRQAASGSTITVKRTRPRQHQLPLKPAEPISKPDAARRQAPSTVRITVHHQKKPQGPNRPPAKKPEPISKPNTASRQAVSIAKSTVNLTKPERATRPIAKTTRTSRPHDILQGAVEKSRAIANSAESIDADKKLQELRLRLTEQKRQIREREQAKEKEMEERMEELRNRLTILREWKEGEKERERRRLSIIARNKRRDQEMEEEEDDTEDLEYYAQQDRWYAEQRERDLAAFAQTEEYQREVRTAFVDFSGVFCEC